MTSQRRRLSAQVRYVSLTTHHLAEPNTEPVAPGRPILDIQAGPGGSCGPIAKCSSGLQFACVGQRP